MPRSMPNSSPTGASIQRPHQHRLWRSRQAVPAQPAFLVRPDRPDPLKGEARDQSRAPFRTGLGWELRPRRLGQIIISNNYLDKMAPFCCSFMGIDPNTEADDMNFTSFTILPQSWAPYLQGVLRIMAA